MICASLHCLQRWPFLCHKHPRIQSFQQTLSRQGRWRCEKHQDKNSAMVSSSLSAPLELFKSGCSLHHSSRAGCMLDKCLTAFAEFSSPHVICSSFISARMVAQFQEQLFSPSNKFLTWFSCSFRSSGAPFWSSLSWICRKGKSTQKSHFKTFYRHIINPHFTTI